MASGLLGSLCYSFWALCFRGQHFLVVGSSSWSPLQNWITVEPSAIFSGTQHVWERCPHYIRLPERVNVSGSRCLLLPSLKKSFSILERDFNQLFVSQFSHLWDNAENTHLPTSFVNVITMRLCSWVGSVNYKYLTCKIFCHSISQHPSWEIAYGSGMGQTWN